MVAIVALGIIGYMHLPVAALPSVDFPTIQVSAQLPGADVKTTASSVATPLGRQFGEIPGLTQMSSSSGSGFTQITLQFDRSRTVDSAAGDVQAAINAAAGQLPSALLTPPTFRKTNPADTPILLIALTSDTLPITKVSDYANSILAQKISQTSGVGLVGIGGLQSPAIHIQVNLAQLAAAGLDLEDVRAALTNATVDQPKGELYGGQTAYALQTNDQLMDAPGFADTILAYRNGAPIRVRDVGRAVIAAEDPTQAGWLNDKHAIMLVLGYSLDNLSLMARTIAVGFVVDDAIVMIENIVRHIEAGATPMQAALDGAREIGFTILSISVSLIAVFIPLFLISGVVGLLFREFAVTVAVSIVVSLIVSLTLTPMLCARLLKPDHDKSGQDRHPGRVSRALERFLDGLVALYDRALVAALHHRRVTLGVMLLTIAATVGLFIVIPKGLFPQQDTGLIIGISEAAQDVSPAGIMERQQAVLNIARQDPAVASAVGYVGAGGATVSGNNGRVFLTLKPQGQRNVTADQVIARLGKALQQVQGMVLYMQAAQDINIGATVSKTQFQYTMTDVDSEELNLYAPQLLQKLQALPQLTSVASDQQNAGRTMSIEVDRAAASRFGIDPARVDSTLYDAFGRRRVARIYTALNQYYVILEADPAFQRGPNALQRLYVRSQSGSEVPLSQIASFKPTLAPLAVNHQGQFPSVTLSFNLASGASIGQAVTAAQRATASLHMPASVATNFQGNAQAFQSSLSSTPPLILAALFAVYIIPGILYESTIHPLTILSTLPSAGFGALATLMLFGRPLDVIGIIGIILLIGIVKKNGIMLVDFALQAERERGLSSEDAIHEACLLRFRLILMTTLCALLGGVPLMLGTGTGSEIRQPLGYAMVGGLLVSQMLTLFTTPVVYLYMDKLSHWIGRLRHAEAVPVAAE